MKKIYLLFVFFFLVLNNSYACKVKNLWKSLPVNFTSECFEKTWSIETKKYMVDVWIVKTCVWRDTFLLKTNEKIDVFIWDRDIIPFKLYKKSWDSLEYNINIDWNVWYIKDNNFKTFLEFDTNKTTSLELSFVDKVSVKMTRWIFDFESNYYYPEFFISEDWKTFSKVKLFDNWLWANLWDFDFKFLKIKFLSKNKDEIIREKIKMRELNFINIWYDYLIKARWKITAYSNNICKNTYYNLSNDIWDYDLDKNTQILELFLSKNNNLDVLSDKDYDHDWVKDSIDNCNSIPNPLQKDSNWDWKWDLCSDDDKDWKIWIKDNCINVYNPLQKDINQNWIWDKCEFDKDKDWVFDYFDNCINIKNSDQLDSDFDWIWDVCDNCKLYNPKQLDIDNNWIWDICDKDRKYRENNDKDKDWILDNKDNCININNPNQEDKDNDWIWDVCDNCIDIQNESQLDFDKNWVWDICEDSDKDGIEWINDNCINVYNPDQKDSDNNRIWDVCEDYDWDLILQINDNCPLKFNPDQTDTDKDWIWDVCDKSDDRFFESNKNLFIWLIIIIIGVFLFFIAIMARKINWDK